MDKTLKDYIDRTNKLLEEERKPSPLPNQYLIYPEQKDDEDKKINPYGQH